MVASVAMFRGSVPTPLRPIVREHVAAWPTGDLYVACSGSFTIERILAADGWRLHSNDVLLYPSAIGGLLAGRPVTVTVADEYADRFAWLGPYLDTPIRTVATILLASRMVAGIGNTPDRRARYRAEFAAQWDGLHAGTVERVEAAIPSVHLETFTAADAVDFAADTGGPIVCFPPTTTAAYESQFRDLERVFDWDAPPYAVLDDDRLIDLITNIAAHDNWLLGLDRPAPLLDGHLRAVVDMPRGPVHVYTSGQRARYVTARQHCDAVPIPRLNLGETIGDRVAVIPLTRRQGHTLRAVYRQPPGSAALTLGVTVDDRLIGFAAYGTGPAVTYGRIAGPAVTLDLAVPVAPTDYPDLGDLVYAVATSTEAARLLERQARRRVRAVTTTIPVGDPVSPLLRHLHTDHDLGVATYGRPVGAQGAADALESWMASHG